MYIIDASAVLAYLFKEPGADIIERYIKDGLAITTVNLTEVILKLKTLPISQAETISSLSNLGMETIDYNQSLMRATAQLDWPRRPYLALADKICLGAGNYFKYPVITADKLWTKHDLPIKIHLIR